MSKNNSLRIKIDKDPYGFGANLFQESYITLKPGLNVLIGCNGAGKSTLLRHIKHVCDDRNIPYYINDSRQRSTRNMVQSALFSGASDAPNFMLAQLEASEGEFHVFGLANRVARELGQFILYDNKNHKGNIVILLDAVDSGLSIDKIQDLKKELFGTILDEKLKPNPDMSIYIVISANTFAMIKDERAIDVQTGKEMSFTDYEEFEKFIMNSRKIRDEIDQNRTDRNDEDDGEDDGEDDETDEDVEDSDADSDEEEDYISDEDKAATVRELQRALEEYGKSMKKDDSLTGLETNPFYSDYNATPSPNGVDKSYIIKTKEGNVQLRYRQDDD